VYLWGSKGQTDPDPHLVRGVGRREISVHAPQASAKPLTPISSPRPAPVDSAVVKAPMASPQPPVVAQRPATADSAPPAAVASRAAGGAPAAPGGTIAGVAAGSKCKRTDTHVVGPG
jgi:hypothetical protein